MNYWKRLFFIGDVPKLPPEGTYNKSVFYIEYMDGILLNVIGQPLWFWAE